MQKTSSPGSPEAISHPDEVERQLGEPAKAFAGGDSRLCFVDPLDPGWCIKILRPDRQPAVKRREQPWLKRLRPLSRFDENLQEIRVYQRIERSIGQAAYRLVPRIDGLAPTNLGQGLRCELIRDDDERISLTLAAYLAQHGHNRALQSALADFALEWQALGMPSRRLLLRNMVVQQRAGNAARLLVIDSLGWADLIPAGYWIPAWARYRARRKLRYLARLIDSPHQK